MLSKRQTRIAEAQARPASITRAMRNQERNHAGSRYVRFHPVGTTGEIKTHSGDVYSVGRGGEWNWMRKAA
jgi:hypothetical protein